MANVCNKVFNIGFHKTGTTSLTWFMRQHGYHVLHNTALSMEQLALGSQMDAGIDDGEQADLGSLIDPALLERLVMAYDFFSDNPWPLLYRHLDMLYPDSKFILTRRDVDSWINSLLKYTGRQRTRMRKLVYGYGNPENHIKRYRQVYLKHNRDVVDYFGSRANLLVIDIEDDDRDIASRLEQFLRLEKKDILFPAANRGVV